MEIVQDHEQAEVRTGVYRDTRHLARAPRAAITSIQPATTVSSQRIVVPVAIGDREGLQDMEMRTEVSNTQSASRLKFC